VLGAAPSRLDLRLEREHHAGPSGLPSAAARHRRTRPV